MIPIFIQTNDNNIFFAFNKIENNYICIPKKIRDYKGHNYREWYTNAFLESLKKYCQYFQGLDCQSYIVQEDDIIKKFDPVEYVLNDLYQKEDKSGYINKLIEAIIDYFQIDKDYIGVEGSHLLNCSNDKSDIDLFVYGYQNSKIIQEYFQNFNSYRNIHLFSDEEAYHYAKKRIHCGFGDGLENVKKQFLKRYYGFINQQQFSIVCVPFESGKGYINLNRTISYVGPLKKSLKIINDDYASIIPSIYQGIDQNGDIYTIEVFNHYGINQAKAGDYVDINASEYINKDTNERLIIYGFWHNGKEEFNVLNGGKDEQQKLFCKNFKKNY